MKAKTDTPWRRITKRDVDRMRSGKVLVTNNIDARDAFNHMSHVWLVSMIHRHEGCYMAYTDEDRALYNLTHWRPAIPEEWRELPAKPRGKGSK